MVDGLDESSLEKRHEISNLEYLRRAILNLIEDIFYVQERIGKDGKSIQVYKIRTMDHDADQNVPQEVIEWRKSEIKDSRIIPSRAWMRKYGVDEFPQIINILKWDMSVFWARPVTPIEFDNLPKVDRKRYKRHKPWILWAHGIDSKDDDRSMVYKQRLYLRLREKHQFNKVRWWFLNVSIFRKCMLHILKWNHK